jgi:transcriptional regulator with XRE-family HTH domain
MSRNDDKRARAGRIRRERERLGLSQDALAKQIGVSRLTQINYEQGKGRLDDDYLAAFHAAGGDAGYVLFGTRSTPDNLYRMATDRVLGPLLHELEVNAEAVFSILDLVSEDEALLYQAAGTRPMPKDSIIEHHHVESLRAALLENGSLLQEIFDGMSAALRDTRRTLPALKRAQIALLLYDVFKERKRVDKKIVKITVAAAVA